MKRKQMFSPDPMNLPTNNKVPRITSNRLIINSCPTPPQIEANNQKMLEFTSSDYTDSEEGNIFVPKRKYHIPESY